MTYICSTQQIDQISQPKPDPKAQHINYTQPILAPHYFIVFFAILSETLPHRSEMEIKPHTHPKNHKPSSITAKVVKFPSISIVLTANFQSIYIENILLKTLRF